MKDKTPSERPHSGHPGHRALKTALAAVLLPLSIGLSAQTSLQWDSAQPGDVYSPRATMARVYPGSGLQVAPLANGFNVRELETLAQGLVANGRVPGLAMAVVHQGQVLSARGYGVTDMQAPETVDAHTVFRLASLSKSFASTATATLVSDGRLRWDSRILDYYPTLRLADPNAALNLDVADVLSHRVGIGSNAFDRDLENNLDYTSLVRKLSAAPMRCTPGECYAYQNIAYSLIGDVVHGASGQPFEDYVARRLFRPLGMRDASYGLEGIAASARWAKPHVGRDYAWKAVYPKPTYYRVAPAAGVNASISDMAQWLIAQSGYRPDVLNGATLATLHSPLIDTPGELRGSKWRRERLNSAGYGLGWRIYDYAGHRLVFHGGAVQGYRGVVALMPERDLAVAILWNSNSSAPSGLLPTILDRAIGVTPQRWLDDAFESEGLYARGAGATPGEATAAQGGGNPTTTYETTPD